MIVTRTISERTDDLPVVLHKLRELELDKIVDEELPKPHGNRKGMSYGQLTVLFLCYIMSQSDHRLCAVESWANNHRQTLEMVTGWPIGEHELSDDRLGDLVEVIGANRESREAIEIRLGQRMIYAYDLPTEVARCDTSSFSVHHQVNKERERESILRFGHSKDKRPDLRQYRQMLGTLDPGGIPLVSETLPGNGADDPLYFPAWQGLVEVIGHKQFIYIGDCKAASQQNRARISLAGGFYCFPLPNTGLTPALLESWVLNSPAPLQEIRLPTQDPQDCAIGVGFSMELGKLWQDPETKKDQHWCERYLVVRSDALAQKQKQGLSQRIEKAAQALNKLAAQLFEDRCQLQNKVQATLKRYRVQDFFSTTINSQVITRYRGRGRPSTKDPSREIRQELFCLQFEHQNFAIEEPRKLAGWRIYVTNASVQRLSLSQGVAYYREQWQLERGFHRFKGGRLPALPLFLRHEERIVGLMFLLTIALRGFTLIEFQVRRQLQKQNLELAGLYAGNPQRATKRPSAEQLLGAFREITFYHHRDGTHEITPLNDLQQSILALMDLPESVYNLTNHQLLIPAPS